MIGTSPIPVRAGLTTAPRPVHGPRPRTAERLLPGDFARVRVRTRGGPESLWVHVVRREPGGFYLAELVERPRLAAVPWGARFYAHHTHVHEAMLRGATGDLE